ncbi:hypothetical protein [Pseudosulfitobacter sp. SM2401]|uniref:hypothetical protein n=1 Tax=Pseudosulfitobacter sp. SM2401 TaxID=3350098 RepID=UPI0036F26061
MKIRICFLVLPLVVSACLPLTTYYRAGVSPARLQSDITSCEVRALRDAPVRLQTQVSPPVWVAPRQICNAANVCTTQPGYYRPGHVYQVDVNKALRGRVETQCMSDKGYAPAKIQPCKNGAATVPASGAAKLPTLTDRSCFLRNSDGTLRVLNQG